VAVDHARNPTLSPCPSIVPRSHAIVTEFISFSNVAAIFVAAANGVIYAFSMRLIGELAKPLYSKNTV
jgi:hypothetical protein